MPRDRTVKPRKLRNPNRFNGAPLPDVPHDRDHNQPRTWNNRHQLILYMVLAGKPSKEIAEVLGYHPDRVSTIKNSPLFRAQLQALTDELKHAKLGDFLAAISNQAMPNLEFLVKMRDDPLYHDGEPAMRIKAASGIASELDRVYPKTRHQVEDRNVRITLDAQALRQMAGALADDDGRHLPALDVDFREAEPPRPLINPVAVDDLMAELEEASLTDEADFDDAAESERRR